MPRPDVVMTREWGPVRGYDSSIPPTVGAIACFSVTKEIRASAEQMTMSMAPADLIELAGKKGWEQAVDRPTLPFGWAILRGVGEPEVRITELPVPEESWREWKITVQMLWIARYVGR